jgi:hypothetical protein
VPLPTQNDRASTLRRICYWFISFLLVVLPFSLLFGRAAGSVGFVLYVTLVLAFPCWCLYLPLIFRIEDANWPRSGILLLSGSLIGPATIFVLGLLTADENFFWKFWSGNVLDGEGTGYYMVFALIVGFLTSAIYVLFLKLALPRHPAAKCV